jgi:hypothetical protein
MLQGVALVAALELLQGGAARQRRVQLRLHQVRHSSSLVWLVAGPRSILCAL